ncbi:MAG TPA: hypothetical protein VG737_05785 [Cyclobacteriaceae bacterium]|nr:hypothetical protein [Cyclobacteriaceae bacterium]
MTLAEFRGSVKDSVAPAQLSPLLQAMWFDAKGDWEKAHEICQEIDTKQGALIHAYLHRKEGDLSNAAYWYLRAGRTVPSAGLDEEWAMIVTELIGH